MYVNDVTLFVSFIAGLVSFISPCVLPLILPFISLITGISVDDLKISEKASKKVIIRTLFFVFGFSLVFIALGMSASQLGTFFGKYKTVLRYIGGCIVILFGLHVSRLLKIKFLYKQFSYTGKNSNTALTNIGVFFAGATFALGWTPCIGPVLASILIVVSTQETVSSGFWLLIFFSLGFGIPFMLTAFFVSKFLDAFKTIKRYYKVIEIASGMLLVLTGVLLIVNDFYRITQLMLS